MGCTPSSPANNGSNSNASGGDQRRSGGPDAANSGGKAAAFAVSNKASSEQRKGSLILTTTSAQDGTSSLRGGGGTPTSATFYPTSDFSPEDTSNSGSGGGGNHPNNNNTLLCCPRMFGFSCCQQCVYRANSNRNLRHHPYQHQQLQQQNHHKNLKTKKTISASLTGLHSMLDQEQPSIASGSSKIRQLSSERDLGSSTTRSSCASLCSVCQQIASNTSANVNSSSSHQQWHLSTADKGGGGGCYTQQQQIGSSSSVPSDKVEKKGAKKKKKKDKEKAKFTTTSEVMRLGGGSGGEKHNTSAVNRQSCSPVPTTRESTSVSASGNADGWCVKHQHRYYRQQLLFSGNQCDHKQYHHWHCPSSSTVCPPRCCCSNSHSQAVVVSSPQSDTNSNTIAITSPLQPTAANNDSTNNSENSTNRRQSETSRTSGVNNNNSAVNNCRRAGNGSDSNRYHQHQQQPFTSQPGNQFSTTTTSSTTNSSLLQFDSSSKGKSMEKIASTAAAPGSNSTFVGGLFRGSSSNGKKHWASQSVRLGRMRIENKKAKALLVLETSADNVSRTVQAAAEQVDFAVSSVHQSAEAAFNAFVELQPEIVIIDARRRRKSGGQSANNSNQHDSANNRSSFSSGSSQFDPLTICKSIRDFKGGEFTCILALVSREQMESECAEDSCDVATLLQGGFTRCLVASSSLVFTANELLQVREFELGVQRRLRAASALLVAVEACKDGVLITGPGHEIQYANHSIEKMFGFRVEELIGRKAQEYFQTELLKADIDERINNFNEGRGEWEGQIAHRRKSGDSVPIWNRILPVNYHNGSPEYIIYVKEFPFLFIEKLMSPETDSSLTYGSLRGLRKTSFDVKSEVRRPSLAKFNSVSMIEAPITRVINILMAIKENGPSFLAPTLEKAIDILKNSEIFLPQFQQSFKPEDQITSELVSSLINSSKQSGVRRMSHEAASNKSSLSLQANSNSNSTGGAPPPPLQPPPTSPSTTTSSGNSSSSASQSITTTATANLLPLMNSQLATNSSSSNQPSLSNVPSAVQTLLEHQLDWNFNVIELERVTAKRPLTWLGMSILRHFNVPATLQCSETVIRNWLGVIEANYHDNPYHNSTHAADVMQATAFFIAKSKRIATALDPMDQAISLIAAIIHDIDHPGRNSAFLCNSSHQLAILYNDISVLESHHAARGFSLTVGGSSGSNNPEQSVNIFASLGPELYRDVRQSVIDMVLATDMTKHFEHLAKFIQNFNTVATVAGVGLADDCETLLELENTESEADSQDATCLGAGAAEANAGDLTPENIVLIKRMLIKCADVSNPARPLKLCQTWAERISTEYCDQTDEEKRLGLKVVMPTFDRATCSIPKSQIGFIDYFANDLFEAWHSFGDFPETVDNMNLNYQYWKDQQALLERKAKKLSLESTKVSEAEEDEEAAAAAAEEEAFAEEDEAESSSVSAKL